MANNATGACYGEFTGLWAMEETRCVQLADLLNRTDWAAADRAQSEASEHQPQSYVSSHNLASGKRIAVIEISGALSKRGSYYSTPSASIKRDVQNAAADPDVGAIMLRIDSPGGTVAGTMDLAETIAAAAKTKMVWSFVEDLAASAAYWLASQTAKIVANNPTAMIGSIGTFIGLYDYSAYAAQNGIRAIVVRTGKYKGAGFSGAEITDEQKAYWQDIVDRTQEHFTAAVAKGRNLSTEKVEESADGRVFVAAEALKRGLIDGIQSYEATLAELAQLVTFKSTPRSNSKMSTENINAATATETTTPRAATYTELKSTCEGASAEFLCAQMEKNATAADAQKAYMVELKKQADEAKQALAQVKTQPAEKAKNGVETLGDGGTKKTTATYTGNARDEWNRKIAETQEARKCSYAEAAKIVNRQNPELRQALVEASNSQA